MEEVSLSLCLSRHIFSLFSCELTTVEFSLLLLFIDWIWEKHMVFADYYFLLLLVTSISFLVCWKREDDSHSSVFVHFDSIDFDFRVIYFIVVLVRGSFQKIYLYIHTEKIAHQYMFLNLLFKLSISDFHVNSFRTNCCRSTG